MGDLGLVSQRSPVTMSLHFMRTAPGCCCSHAPGLLRTRPAEAMWMNRNAGPRRDLLHKLFNCDHFRYFS
jgi:hypothetical protein